MNEELRAFARYQITKAISTERLYWLNGTQKDMRRLIKLAESLSLSPLGREYFHYIAKHPP